MQLSERPSLDSEPAVAPSGRVLRAEGALSRELKKLYRLKFMLARMSQSNKNYRRVKEQIEKMVSKNPQLKKHRKNPTHFKNDRMKLTKYFERDRKHIALVNDVTGETVIEWWDGAVDDAIEDGFLDPRDYMNSAMKYARDHKLIWGENRPEKAKNPMADKDVVNCVAAILYLDMYPGHSLLIDKKVLDALKSEGLWSLEKGVTDKGRKFVLNYDPD